VTAIDRSEGERQIDAMLHLKKMPGGRSG